MKNNMKNAYWLIGIMLAVIVFFNSYNTGETLEENDYIMALGFDLSEEGKMVSLEFPELKKDEADAVLDNPQQIKKIQVSHFKDFVDKYNSENANKLNLHHLKLILIGNKLLEDEEQFKYFVSFLQEQNEFAENIYIAVDSAEGKLFSGEEGSIGNYMETLIEKKAEKQPQNAVTVGRFLSSVYNKNQTIFLPVVSEERKIIGEWDFACGKPGNFIDEDTAKWYMLGNCVDCDCEIYLKEVYTEISDEKQNYSIDISKISREITFKEENGSVAANMIVKIKGKGKDYAGDILTDEKDRLEKAEFLSQCMTNKLNEYAEISKGKDLFNTYYELSTKSRSLWSRYQNSYEDYVKNLNLNISVQVTFTD